ncbi:hypothetical protein OCS_03347 [Ophiocordyceps sinensis CO18]|uniref:AMP-activated protein kinase glycogen-binding domain-containing protein n=1 Tax=Ophiocordyceps sinensis (strain Co18 / CGMCC 3.14243) TaxID=911162 RepID=T5AGI9_OPHSC|nr:hypothetical protein OCS_03347 [Ophiocordyceps sinensis CO18]
MPGFSTFVTIAFRKAGAQPPVYLAGTFSNPAWQPREMQCTLDDAGEHYFTAQVSVQPGLEYWYKFRVGESDDWVLDEHSSIVTDDQGYKTNLLKVPLTDIAAEQTQLSPEVMQDGIESVPPLPSLPGTMNGVPAQRKSFAPSVADATNGVTSRTPTGLVSATAAQAAHTTPQLDIPQNATSPHSDKKSQDAGEAACDHEDFKSPLFAHEAFGASETAHDGFGHEPQDFAVNSPDSALSFGDSGVGRMDVDDPTLEKFPCERASVLDALRRIQSSHDDNHPRLDHLQLSPWSAPPRGGFADTPDGGVALGSGRRESRLSHSGLGRTRSAVSLGSIAEEPKGDDFAQPATPENKTLPTDEDDVLMMRPIKA